MAIRVAHGRVVRLAYRLTDANGSLIEDRTPENPFEYIQGKGQIVPALEKIVEGKTAGFQAEVQLSAREGYGEYKPALVAEIPTSKFPTGSEIAVGMKFNTTGPGGQPITVRVIEVDEKKVTVDGNHPLAGVELIFELRVLDVREASEVEAEDGAVDPDFDSDSGSGQLH